MTTWGDFAAAAPALAEAGRRLFESTELVMLGSLRRDGRARITPVEFSFFENDLVIGGMWRSMKALDLLRDPRCVLHSTTWNKNGEQGDFKLYADALDADPEYLARYAGWIEQALGSAMNEPFHCFRLDISSAAFVQFGEVAAETARRLMSDAETRVRSIHGAAGEAPDVVATWRAPRRTN